MEVFHSAFGKGKVVSVEKTRFGLTYVIKFDSLNTNRNIFADFKGLSII